MKLTLHWSWYELIIYKPKQEYDDEEQSYPPIGVWDKQTREYRAICDEYHSDDKFLMLWDLTRPQWVKVEDNG